MKKYKIYVCPKCKNQISEYDMGKKCPHCEEWQYHHLAEKEVAIIEEINKNTKQS